LLLIGTTRPELEQSSPDFLTRDARRLTVNLQTLSAETAAALLGDLAGDPAYAETPFAEVLIANAGGNPLFLEESVRMLREEGLLDLERWKSGEMRDVPVPTNVQALISSRLDRLDAKEKQIAHHASVIGTIFWESAVAHLGAHEGSPVEDPEPQLDELERRDFVHHQTVSSVAADEEYAFKHILMRDVAYGQVPKGRRAQLHLAFSEWVGGLPRSADEFVEIVAWHLEQACLLSREVARSPIEPPILEAATALANAGHRAARRESLREAHRYYTRAIDVLGESDDDLYFSVRLHRADMAMMLGLLQEANDELLAVATSSAELGRDEIESEALLLLGDIDQRQGRPGDAHDRLTEAQRLAGLVQNARLQARAAFVLTTFVGDYLGEPHEQVIESLRTAIALAEGVDARELVAEGHLRIAALLMSQDLPNAEPELRRCLEVANDLGSHRIEAEATSWLGIVDYYRGRPAEAEQLCLQAHTWFERTGDTYFHVQNVMCGLAIFAQQNGRVDDAEKLLREVLPVALQIGGWALHKTYWHLVEALVAQGRLDDAREIVATSAESVPEEDPQSRSWLLLSEGLVATAAGESDKATASFTEALRLLDELDYKLDIAEAQFVLARSLRAQGDAAGARTALAQARELFVLIGADIRRDAIDAEVAELADES
jgi:tetratricopeptide (TPR) repeat protein